MEDEKEIKKMANLCKIGGNIITREWWKHTNMEFKEKYARRDMKAIIRCDLFIFYNSKTKTSGKYVELGMAIALNKPVHIYGKPLTTIFRHNFTEYKGKNYVVVI